MLYLRGEGRYDEEYAELSERLVPGRGQAMTVQGELVRAIGRLASEYYRNGNMNWDEHFSAFTRYLERHLCDATVFDERTICRTGEDLAELRRYGEEGEEPPYEEEGEDAFDRITDRVVEWVRRHPELIARAMDPDLRR